MKGQTIVEYVILVGIVTMALMYMGPAIKRGVQSVIKGSADQLAVQNTSEQSYDDQSGHLDQSNSVSAMSSNRAVRERIYTTNTSVAERTESSTNTTTNMGFTAQ